MRQVSFYQFHELYNETGFYITRLKLKEKSPTTSSPQNKNK